MCDVDTSSGDEACVVPSSRHDQVKEPKPVVPALDPENLDTACCLAWTLGHFEQEHVSPGVLQVFHDQIASCVAVFKARVISDDAASGVILANELPEQGLTPEDSAVRLGQILCRWAVEQKPQFRVRMGVHTGKLTSLRLPNSSQKVGYFGPAVSKSQYLAGCSQNPMHVHMSRASKERLHALELLPMHMSLDRNSYYLGPFTEVVEAINPCEGQKTGTINFNQQGSILFSWETDINESTRNDGSQLRIEDFSKMLERKQVDVNAFGTHGAKSMAEFYAEVVIQGKSHLIEMGGHLERIVPLLRISLRTRDSSGVMRELRIASQTTEFGQQRVRNQQLAMALTQEETKDWRTAIRNSLQRKIGLSPKDQQDLIKVMENTYKCQEERKYSRTVPGIPTTYKSQSITLLIPNPQDPRLVQMGLPGCRDFTTHTNGMDYFWTWAEVGSNSDADELQNLLQDDGIDISVWSKGAFLSLYSEVHEKFTATLEKKAGHLVRTIRIIKVWLKAIIATVEHVLVLSLKVKGGTVDDRDGDKPISMQMRGEDWEQAVRSAIYQKVGLSPQLQERYLTIDLSSYKFVEEVALSRSYPGLKTVYLVNAVSVYVTEPHSSDLRCIGLPDGNDFCVSRMDGSEIVVTQWSWKDSEELVAPCTQNIPSLKDESMTATAQTIKKTDGPRTSTSKGSKQRLPVPEALPPSRGTSQRKTLLQRLMTGASTNWTRAKRAAALIRDPNYSTRDFFEDVTAAFPELRLYVSGGQQTSSGRGADDEYQRTMGALFCIYWMMRLHLEGAKAFCFGLNSDWVLRHQTDDAEKLEDFHKRSTFYDQTDWDKIEELFVHAGLLYQKGPGTHNADRTLAMLVLMAIHDIMKITELLPTVETKPGIFQGYKVGEKIGDHDIALSYVLEHHPGWLPSFSGLPKAQQHSVIFTHSKLDYNMGWLVQAEAPPGALFSALKQVVTSGQAKPQDIAFYFVHWFADLSGAEPHPMEGCERFVLKFPQKVLKQFMDSLSIVQTLGSGQSETDVYEKYLMWRWESNFPKLGPVPEGEGAVALMRLVIMASTGSEEVIDGFHQIPAEDRKVLAQELAITGCKGQRYLTDDKDVPVEGPAILVYYAPALMQKLGQSNPKQALIVLAEVLRQTRRLWPLSGDNADMSVIMRIESLKEKDPAAFSVPDTGNIWVVHKTSERDGAVKHIPLHTLGDVDWINHRVLVFHRDTSQRKSGPTAGKRMSTI